MSNKLIPMIATVQRYVAPMGILAVLFLVGVLILFNPWWVEQEVVAAKQVSNAVVTGLLLAVAGGIIIGRIKLVTTTTLIVVGAITLFVGVLTAMSSYQGLTFSEWHGFYFEQGTLISSGVLAMLFIVGYIYASLRGNVTRLLHAIAVPSSIVVIGFLIDTIFSTTYAEMLFGTTLPVIFLAGSVYIISAGHLHVQELWLRWLYIGIHVVCTVALLVSGEGLLMIAGAVGAGALVVVTHGAYQPSIFFVRWIRYGTIGLLILVGLLTSFGLTSFNNIPAQEVRPSLQSTMHVLLSTYSTTPEIFFIGMGANSFDISWNQHAPTSVHTSAFWDTDMKYGASIFSTYILAFGVPVMLLLLLSALYLVALGHSIRIQTHYVSWIVAIVLMFLLFVFGVYVTSSTTIIGIGSICAGALLGLYMSIRTDHAESHRWRRWSSYILGIICITGGVVSAAWSLHNMSALVSYDNALTILTVGEEPPSQAHNDFRKSLNAVFDPTVAQVFAYSLEKEATGSIEVARNREEIITAFQIIGEAESYARTAQALDVHDYRSWITLGNIQARHALIKRDTVLMDDAIVNYKNAADRAPGRPLPLLLEAKAKVVKGDIAGARVLLQKIPHEEAQTLLKSLPVVE